MPWRTRQKRLKFAVWVVLAVAWLILGNHSQHVPVGSHTFWLLSCGMVAGSAIGVAHRDTPQSVGLYLLLATAVGAIRSVAYLHDNNGGPASVWAVITVTNLILYEEWSARSNGG